MRWVFLSTFHTGRNESLRFKYFLSRSHRGQVWGGQGGSGGGRRDVNPALSDSKIQALHLSRCITPQIQQHAYPCDFGAPIADQSIVIYTTSLELYNFPLSKTERM